jgi:hypothetical protein
MKKAHKSKENCKKTNVFCKNKPNSPIVHFFTRLYMASIYNVYIPLTELQNKPKSNPNQTQFKPKQTQSVICLLSSVFCFSKTNPIQTQTNPIATGFGRGQASQKIPGFRALFA